MTLPLCRPLVYLISDGSITDDNYEHSCPKLLETIHAAAVSRMPLVQIRERNLSGKNLFDLASRAVAITRRTNTRVLINDRLDVALASGADGVHVTSNSFSPLAVREVAPDGFVVGVSTHTVNEVENAKNAGADLAVFGPVFETPGKANATGLDELKSVVRAADPFSVLALGGIDQANYRDVLSTGAAGFAAIRFLNSAANLEMLSKEFGYE